MGFATSQQLANFYSRYQAVDIVFTKDVIQGLRFNSRHVFIRSSGGQWPCVVNSASMRGAKIVWGKNSGLYEKIAEGILAVSLRFSFLTATPHDMLAFFVSAKVTASHQYMDSADLVLLSLEYTQRAPDALIERLGTLIEAKVNSKKRAEERILLTDDAMRRMNLVKKETVIFVQRVPRRCILRDISFSGAKIILVGVSAFLANQEGILKFEFEEPPAVFGIRGKTLRTEPVQGRKDLVAVSLQFDPETVPIAYKMRLSEYFSHKRKVVSTAMSLEKDSATNESTRKPLGYPTS